MLIDPEQLMQAFDETKYQRSQVQGFQYGNRHVIRDCMREPGKQEIWSMDFNDRTHDISYHEMERRIRLEEFRIVCEYYHQLDDPIQ